MILTDYFRSEPDITWHYAKQCGVNHGVIRLPETTDFDITDIAHWREVHDRFTDYGIKPIIVEPLPNELHDHIKIGDEKRDESIEKAIKMLSIMNELDIRTICFNFMAHIGWLRTDEEIQERGGALVSGFDIKNFKDSGKSITEAELWQNYEYFIRAILPHAEKNNIKLALHPDDPPVPALGGVSRILVSAANIERALNIVSSPNLGITMCQATYFAMGEDLYKVIPHFKEKIFFIHFRNITGSKNSFRETFHDNGDIDMKKIIALYRKCNIDMPIRVDHVPTMAGERDTSGYSALGRLFALGYLKGLLE